jgi:uncharacterized protein (TIGR02118 family)
MLQLTVLYPQPTDVQKFEEEYVKHKAFFHEKTGIPPNDKSYTMVKFLPSPEGPPPFHRMFTQTFESPEALDKTMASPEMQAVAADAHRISSGGAPTMLVGNQV